MTGDQCEVILDQIRELNKQMDSLLKLMTELVELNQSRWVSAPEVKELKEALDKVEDEPKTHQKRGKKAISK